jgi:hypothetical protein
VLEVEKARHPPPVFLGKIKIENQGNVPNINPKK